MSEKLAKILVEVAKFDQRNITEFKKKELEFYVELEKIDKDLTPAQQEASLGIRTIIANDRANSLGIDDLKDRKERFGLFVAELTEQAEAKKKNIKDGQKSESEDKK